MAGKAQGMEKEIAAVCELQAALEALSKLCELQVQGAQQMVAAALGQFMTSISSLSQEVETKAKDADAALLATYMQPDLGTQRLVADMQDSVDQLIASLPLNSTQSASTQAGKGKEQQNFLLAKEGRDETQLRRLGSNFSKSMESLSLVDKEMESLVFRMVAALSNEDVIGQRLEHMIQSMQALRRRFATLQLATQQAIEERLIGEFKDELLKETYKLFTTEDEKKLFATFFKLQNKSSR